MTTTMQLRAASFRDGEAIPARHGGERGRAIELQWLGEPAGTRSFVLLVDDPHGTDADVPWVRFDLPAGAHGLATDDTELGRWGGRRSASAAWRGPAPPPGGERRYVFRLYALDVPSLDLPAGAPLDEVRARMDGHVLDAAELSAVSDGSEIGGGAAAADPAAERRVRSVLWIGVVVYLAIGVLLLFLGLTGIVIAAVLGSIALVALMIAVWRRMSQPRADGAGRDPARPGG